jgi:hypothetical protein
MNALTKNHKEFLEEQGPTIKEISSIAVNDGYGNKLGDTYEELGSDPVVLGGKYVVPEWMAEIFGRIGKR